MKHTTLVVPFQINNANFSVGEGLVELDEIPPPLAGGFPPNHQRETTLAGQARVSPTY